MSGPEIFLTGQSRVILDMATVVEAQNFPDRPVSHHIRDDHFCRGPNFPDRKFLQQAKHDRSEVDGTDCKTSKTPTYRMDTWKIRFPSRRAWISN